MDDRHQGGVTLLELLLALALLAVLITVAVPSFGHWLERQRLQGAARTIAGDLRHARQEAITQSSNQPVYLHFQTGSNWCYGFSRQSHCDCRKTHRTAAHACLFDTRGTARLSRRDGQLYHGVALTGARFSGGLAARFDPLRGLASAGRLTLQNRHRDQIEIRLSALGRVRLCSSGKSPLPGVEPC